MFYTMNFEGEFEMTRLIEEKDLYQLHSITSPILSPNGKEAILNYELIKSQTMFRTH